MASLLSLPAEARAIIIEHVIGEERAFPGSAGHRSLGRVYLPADDVEAVYGQGNTRLEREKPVPNADGLLLTNWKLRVETQAALGRLFPNGIRYKLDMRLVDECFLLPTWLSLPISTRRLAALDIVMRIDGGRRMGRPNIFRSGQTGPSAIIWELYYALDSFLRDGLDVFVEKPDPGSPLARKGRKLPAHRPMRHRRRFKTPRPGCLLANSKRHFMLVDSINIDAMLCESGFSELEDTPVNSQVWHYGDVSVLGGLTEDSSQRVPYTMNSRWLARHVHSGLRTLLHIDRDTEKYGAFIFDKVGVFNVMCKGKKLNPLGRDERENRWLCIDANVCLADAVLAPWPNSSSYRTRNFRAVPSHCTLLAFWNWKYRTVKLRKKLGWMDTPWEDMKWPKAAEIRRWRALKDAERAQLRANNSEHMSRMFCEDKWEVPVCQDKGLEGMLETIGMLREVQGFVEPGSEGQAGSQ